MRKPEVAYFLSNFYFFWKFRKRRHDTQHNDIQHNDIQQIIICDSQYKWESALTTFSITTFWHYVGCHHAECHISFSVMLNGIMLSVVMMNVMMPLKHNSKWEFRLKYAWYTSNFCLEWVNLIKVFFWHKFAHIFWKLDHCINVNIIFMCCEKI